MTSNKPVTPRQKDIPTSEKFMQRGREKRAKGEESVWWFRAAEIIKRIEDGKPVGHWRRRNRRAGQ